MRVTYVLVRMYVLMTVCVSSCDMMAELLKSSDLFMMQVEMDAYTLAKKVCPFKQLLPHTHARTRTHTHTVLYVWMDLCMYGTYVCMYAHTYVITICMYVCVFKQICVIMSIYECCYFYSVVVSKITPIVGW